MKRLCRKLRGGLQGNTGGCLARHPEASKARELPPARAGGAEGGETGRAAAVEDALPGGSEVAGDAASPAVWS